MQPIHTQSTVSSERPGHEAAYAIDDSNGTSWQPAENDRQPTLTIDLVAPTEFEKTQFFQIDSARIEFSTRPGGFGGGRGAGRAGAPGATPAPTPAAVAGRPGSTAFRYTIEASLDGK